MKTISLFMRAAVAAAGLLLLTSQYTVAQQTTPAGSSKHDYVLLVRLNPESVQPEQARNIKARWDSVVTVWNKTNSYKGGKTFLQEGTIISGSRRSVEKGALYSDHLRVISVIHLSAGSLEEATGLAKACPTLDMGGTVEVREVRP